MKDKVTGAGSLRSRLQEGEVVWSAQLTWQHPGLAEALGRLGFDAVVVDAEHSAFDEGTLQDVVRAAECAGADVVVRTPRTGPDLSRLFDAGIAGVQIPFARSVDQVRSVIDAVKYPPAGCRSVGRVRALDWGLGPEGWLPRTRRSNDATCIIAQVEDDDGVRAARGMLGLEHVDGLIVGVADLAQGLGHIDDLTHPEVRAAVDRVREECRRAGKPLGVGVRSRQDVGEALDQGARYLMTTVLALLADSSSRLIG